MPGLPKEAEAARDFAGLLARVRAGAEAVIESEAAPIAVLRTAAPPGRSIEEWIALLPEDSTATIDEDFVSDVAAAVGVPSRAAESSGMGLIQWA